MNMLKVKKLNPNAILPTRSTDGSAGLDLYACIGHPISIEPGEIASIPIGIAIALENSAFVGLVFGRSGLGVKHGIVPANAVGVIDSDYRGQIIVGLVNQSKNPYTIMPGDRIAQLVIMPVLTPEIKEVEELSQTVRGSGGFGSTGNQ